MANLAQMCKKIWTNCPLSRDIQLENIQGRNPYIIFVGN